MSSTKELTQVIHEWSEVFMHRSMRDFKRFMDETDLSFSQISVLMRLKHAVRSGVSEIGGQMGVTKAAASQAVDRLVDLDLIERAEDPHDRRAKKLALTQKGQEVIERAIQARGQWIEALAVALTPTQQELIIDALTMMTRAAREIEK